MNTIVLMGYLIGLCVVRWVVAVMSGYCASRTHTLKDSTALRQRLIGAVTLGVGITFLVEITEPMLMPIS